MKIPPQTLARGLLLASAAALPLSIALAQATGFSALAVWLYDVIRRRDGAAFRSPFAWPLALFALAAVFSSAIGLRPAHCLEKCHRLLFYLAIFAVPSLGRSAPEGPLGFARRLTTALLIGTALLGVYDLVRIPVRMLNVPEGTTALAWLYDQGNMRDPQFYLTALCLLIAAWPEYVFRMQPVLRGGAAGLYALGMLLHFKRGVWLAFGPAAAVVIGATRRWRLLAALVLLAALLPLAPPVRARLGLLRQELDARRGGRMALWTELAPQMIREYPMGIGLCAARHEDFKARLPTVENRLNHLHNNLLQVLLETGWAGFAAWLWWMGTAFAVMIRNARRGMRAGPPARWIAAGSLGAFTGLMLDGLVEYNFGDGEILMLVSILLGLAALLREALPAPSAGTSP